MRSLTGTIVLAAGRGRAALVIATTGATSGLLLVAISIARLPGSDRYEFSNDDRLLAPLADPGTRPGSVLAVVLLAVPVLLLLDQAVRLGSVGQHRRYSALAVAGATRRDLRRWAAIEVGGPALVGGLLGLPVWLLLRELLGHELAQRSAALVPTSTGPGLWTVLVVVGLAAYGAVVGRRAGSRATAVVERRRARRAPRAWPTVLVIGCALVITGRLGLENIGVPIAAVILLVAGAIGLAPWAAYRAASVAARSASTAGVLLAARRLQADPRPAGRAAAAVGAVALAAGVLGVFVSDILDSRNTYGAAADYLVPAAVVGACALVAMAMIATSLAVHSVEMTLERSREMSALVATGVPVSTVGRAQQVEALLTTLPLAVVASLLGALGYGELAGVSAVAYAGGLAATLVTALVVVAMVRLAAAAVRPWLAAAVDPDNLRTE